MMRISAIIVALVALEVAAFAWSCALGPNQAPVNPDYPVTTVADAGRG